MESLESIRNRVQELIEEKIGDDDDGICFTNNGESGITLDSCGDEVNIVVHTIYPNLYADTNIGYINLADMVDDEDDWYTIEDVVADF